MSKKTRQHQILRYISFHETVDVKDLSKEFNVSEATIRRDLIELDQNNEISRVHGGAIITEEQHEPFSLPRASLHHEIKRRIGKAAADMVKDGESIIISTGTTTEAMVPFLCEKKGLTVITNALNIAYRLSQYQHINTIVLGGMLRHHEFDLLGHITENSLNGLVATKLFRGVQGIHIRHGYTANDITHVNTDQKMLDIVHDLIILADHSKFNQMGSVTLAPINAASAIITDSEVDPEKVAEVKDLGVKVIIV